MKSTTILFMCPHGAAKSVLAGAYCRQLAAERQLDWTILTAGTDPDEEQSAAVVALLRSEGLAIADEKPHRVTAAELAAADWIVSMGCDLSGLDTQQAAVENWDDVLPPSENLVGAKQTILFHLEQFMNQAL